MTTIPSGVYQGAENLTEEEKTDLVPATAGEVAKYFDAVPAQNKRLRGHDVGRRSTPGDPTNEDTRVLMAFVKALYNALFNGEWADPNTLELAPNGKIRVKDVFVDGDRAPDVNNGNDFYLIEKLPETVKAKVAGFLKSGGGLSFDTNGELQVDFQDLTVDQLTPLCDPDGGIIVNDDEDSDGYGKLKIDFASMDPAIMRAVVYAMTQQGGGLSVDGNGQLYVDFDSMPTDKFEALLASLKMQTPLTANKILYVDNVLGSDTITVDGVTRPVTIIDNHGGASDPFATIQACVTYATSKYAIGEYLMAIRVITNYDENNNKIPYRENVTLPLYNRTSGNIRIAGYTTKVVNNQTVIDPPVVMSPQGSSTSLFHCIGGTWHLRNLDFQCIVAEPANPTANMYPAAIEVDGASTEVALLGSSVSIEMTNTPTLTSDVSVIAVDSGKFYFSLQSGYSNSLTCLAGDSSHSCFIQGRNATIQMPAGNPNVYTQDDCTVMCSGTADVFLSLIVGSSFVASVGAGYYQQSFSGSPTVTKQYSLQNGSGCAAPSGGFPGTNSGTADSASYSWYAINS